MYSHAMKIAKGAKDGTTEMMTQNEMIKLSVPESAELPCAWPYSLAAGVLAPGPAAEEGGGCETATAAESPGTTPAPDRRGCGRE